jgi:hypothetical protein
MPMAVSSASRAVSTQLGAAAPFIAGMRGSFFICSSGILGRYVKQIDSTMDDGNTAGGSVQAVARYRCPWRGWQWLRRNIVDGTQYTVCSSY